MEHRGKRAARRGAVLVLCAVLLAGSGSASLLGNAGGAAGQSGSQTVEQSQRDAARQPGSQTVEQSQRDAAGQSGAASPGTARTDAAAPSMKLETWQGIPCEADAAESFGGGQSGGGTDGAEGEPSGGSGDGWTVTIEKPPKHGVCDTDGTRLTYTPAEGFTGTDRFTYTLSDGAGRTSKPGKVTVRVKKAAVRYEDMDGNPAASAAQELAEAGVFTGENIGGRYFFGPDAPVTRAEFLAMALEALGREAPAVTVTGFSDDEAIPAWAKPYVSAAVSAGILRGVSTEAGAAFQGDSPVTWQQAAAMLDRALDTADVDLAEWFGDREAAELWAAQSVGNLEVNGILSAGSFGSLTMERAMTREDAARLLVSARAAVREDGEPSGLLDRLADWLG